MCLLNKLNNPKKVYSIVIIFVLFLNTFFFNKLYASSFHISDIEIHEEFGSWDTRKNYESWKSLEVR